MKPAPLPRVLLLGDSIRIGYCATVAKELSDIADVVYPDENCANSQHVLTRLEHWAAQFPNPTIVHINFGQWDAARFAGCDERLTSPEEYRRNTRMIFRALARFFPGARRYFATTTPMRQGTGPRDGLHPRTDADIDEYNAIAVPIAREEGLEIDDLNAFARGWPAEAYQDFCHFTPEAFGRLGMAVAAFLRERLR